ncbi:unnamed protein product [Sphagnum balticum]
MEIEFYFIFKAAHQEHIDIHEEDESAFDPAEVGSELCPEAPLFKAEQLGESGGGCTIIPKELGIETPGSNTSDILAEKQFEEEEVPVILDAAAATKETAEVRLRVLLLHDDDDMNPSLLLITDVEDALHMVSGAIVA